MSAITSILATILLISTVTASLVNHLEKRSFSVEQIEHGTFIKNGAGEYVRTLLKYNKPVPDSLREAANDWTGANLEMAGVNGTVAAVPGDAIDSLYLTPVTVGETTMQFDMDTGSSNM
jgi:hypothetical protein